MYNKLNLLPYAKLTEEQVNEIKTLEKKLAHGDNPVYLMALCPPELKS